VITYVREPFESVSESLSPRSTAPRQFLRVRTHRSEPQALIRASRQRSARRRHSQFRALRPGITVVSLTKRDNLSQQSAQFLLSHASSPLRVVRSFAHARLCSSTSRRPRRPCFPRVRVVDRRRRRPHAPRRRPTSAPSLARSVIHPSILHPSIHPSIHPTHPSSAHAAGRSAPTTGSVPETIDESDARSHQPHRPPRRGPLSLGT